MWPNSSQSLKYPIWRRTKIRNVINRKRRQNQRCLFLATVQITHNREIYAKHGLRYWNNRYMQFRASTWSPFERTNQICLWSLGTTLSFFQYSLPSNIRIEFRQYLGSRSSKQLSFSSLMHLAECLSNGQVLTSVTVSCFIDSQKCLSKTCSSQCFNYHFYCTQLRMKQSTSGMSQCNQSYKKCICIST